MINKVHLQNKNGLTKREVTSSVLRTVQRPLEGKTADWQGSGFELVLLPDRVCASAMLRERKGLGGNGRALDLPFLD